MRAWLQTAFGGQEVRELAEVPAPRAAEDEVLVRVRCVALNRLDVLQRRDSVVDTFSLPHIAGMDIVGVVESTGGTAGADLIGSRVIIDPVVTCEACDMCADALPMYCRELRTIGSSRAGGLAEYVAVPARNCVRIPADVADSEVDDLASIPVASVTAWHALRTTGKLTAGESVVIPGAGSGLGAAGIQIAKQQGCVVIALVAGEEKMEPARSLGADHVVDRKATDWVTHARSLTRDRGVDVVWDHVGGEFLQQAIDATRIGGRVIMSGTTAGSTSTIRNTSVFHWGRSLLGHGGYDRQEMADTLASYLEGNLRSVIDSRWNFEDLPEAERRLESGAFFGKILVRGPGRNSPSPSESNPSV